MQLKNVRKKMEAEWNDICTRCYNENNNDVCNTYFPGQPISKFFPDEKQQKCDLFNCKRCKEIDDTVKWKECCNANKICRIDHGKCKKKPEQQMDIWKVNFKDYLLKCGIVYIGTFFPLPSSMSVQYSRRYQKTFGSNIVWVQNYYKVTLSDIGTPVAHEITDVKKYFGVRCINIQFPKQDIEDQLISHLGEPHPHPEQLEEELKQFILSEAIEAVVTLYPSITKPLEKVTRKFDEIYHHSRGAQHYFFTMIKPTDDYVFPLKFSGISAKNEQFLSDLKSQGIVGDDAKFNTEPGNHTTEDIDIKIKEQEQIYSKVSSDVVVIMDEKNIRGTSVSSEATQLGVWSGASKKTKNIFKKFIDLVYPKALNFFKYRIYIDTCGQTVCASIAYNLFFLSTKLYREIPFTFTEKAFITLIFIFHHQPTNKRGPYRKGWQFSLNKGNPTERKYWEGTAVPFYMDTPLLVFKYNRDRNYKPKRTKGCTNCEQFSFKYPKMAEMNACDRGCETRVTKIFNQIPHSNEKEALTARNIVELCCDRGLKKGVCPREGNHFVRQNSFLRRNFYYYIHQVFKQLVTPLKDNELQQLLEKSIPASWKEGYELGSDLCSRKIS